MEMMIMHGQAVSRGLSQAMMVIDMPFGSYEEAPEQAFRNAAHLMAQTNAAAVKLEGGVSMAPTIRDSDGVALSSRNALLLPEQRQSATGLIKALRFIEAGLQQGCPLSSLQDKAEAQLLSSGFDRVEYLDLRNADDLSLLDKPTKPARLFGSAWLGDMRIIDNIAVPVIAPA